MGLSFVPLGTLSIQISPRTRFAKATPQLPAVCFRCRQEERTYTHPHRHPPPPGPSRRNSSTHGITEEFPVVRLLGTWDPPGWIGFMRRLTSRIHAALEHGEKLLRVRRAQRFRRRPNLHHGGGTKRRVCTAALGFSVAQAERKKLRCDSRLELSGDSRSSHNRGLPKANSCVAGRSS